MTTQAPERCRVCNAAVPRGAARCPSCCAALGPQDPCPACRAQAGSSPHVELRYACDVCGAPRVPRLDRSIKYSGREVALLRKADAARKARAGWRAAAIADGLLLPFALAITAALLLIFGASAALIMVTLMVLLPIGGFLAFALGRAQKRGAEIPPALDAAWISAATDIARQSRGMSASTLAEKLGIEEPQAEEMMALLDVNAMVSPLSHPPMRIEEPPSIPASPARGGASPIVAGDTHVAAAEEEAALAEQIAEEEKAKREGKA